MFPCTIPPTYIMPVFSSEQANSDNFEFGNITILDSRENIILCSFQLWGGYITDKQAVEWFLKDNPLVADSLNATTNRLSEYFNEESFKLELSQINGEQPELFLIVETKKDAEEALSLLAEFDKWFIPNIFKEFT